MLANSKTAENEKYWLDMIVKNLDCAIKKVL